MIIIQFVKGSVIISTKQVDVYFNEYGRNRVTEMLRKGLLTSPKDYDSYQLYKGTT